jgi:hypothetical protein
LAANHPRAKRFAAKAAPTEDHGFQISSLL